jgi:RsmE family RNA methyltransferase
MNIILFREHEAGIPLEHHDARAEHLLKVLHKHEGDTFDAGILGGLCGTGTITRLRPSGGIEFSLSLTKPPPSKLPLALAVGFPRPIQLRRILRDMAGFGVERISLLETELGDKSYRNTTLLNKGGGEAALIEGLSQARDTALPLLERFSGLEAYIRAAVSAKMNADGQTVALIAADNVRPQGIFADMPACTAAAVAVGPERGWSDRERMLLDEAGFARLSLGARALRTETACIAACALVQAAMHRKALV